MKHTYSGFNTGKTKNAISIWLSLPMLTLLTACAMQTPPSETMNVPPSTSPTKAVSVPATAQVHAEPALNPETPRSPIPYEAEQTAKPYDKVAALKTWTYQQDRLYRVAAPLLINNVELCPDRARNLLGLTAKTKYSYSEDFVDAAKYALNLGNRLRVMSILPGSGASLAGLHKGDILVAVEIEPLPQGPEAETGAASLIGSEMQGRTSVTLTILRDGSRMVFDIPLTPACAMAIDLGNSDSVNSYADGDRLMVTRGMLNFVRSDDELAYILAKEIANNVLAPASRPDMTAEIDRLHTLHPITTKEVRASTLAPYSPDLDATTDELALYLLVRAGYSIDHVLEFWERLAATYPAEIKNGYTALHPSTAYRMSVMSQKVKTVQMKQNNDLSLVPSLFVSLATKTSGN